MTGGRGKGTNKVNMNVGKFLRGNRNGMRGKMGVTVNFGGLAGKASAAKIGNVLGHVRPNISGRNKAFGGTGTRVGQIMDMVKEGLAEGSGNKRTKNASGNVTMEGGILERVGRWLEGGGGKEVRNVRTG